MAKNTKKIVGIVGKRFPNKAKRGTAVNSMFMSIPTAPVRLTGNIVEHEIEDFDVDVDENGPFISSSLG